MKVLEKKKDKSGKRENPKVSVIVPVYNTEQYLKRCLDSLLNQTLKDIEIICVDDGSTDKSPKILDEYAFQDNRILVIHKENSGAGESRNCGLDVAHGKYVCFVDSDDWIDVDFIEKLFLKANINNLDFVKGNVFLEYPKSRLLSNLHKEIHKQLALGKNIACCLSRDWWSILYKKEIIEKYNLKFTNSHLGEDTLFLISYVCRTRKFDLIDDTYYHYFQRTNSLVHTYRSGDWRDVLFVTHKIGEVFSLCNIDAMSIAHYMKMRTRYFLSFWDSVKQYSSSEDKQDYLAAALELSSYLHRFDATSELAHISCVDDIEKFLKRKKIPLRQKLFSIKNSWDKRHKVVTILGIAIRIKRRKLAS